MDVAQPQVEYMHEPVKRKRTKFTALYSLLLLAGCVVVATGFVLYSYLQVFTQASHVGLDQIFDSVQQGYRQREEFADRQITFLILGLDERSDALEKTVLTDAIILASLSTASGEVTMMPLPRDLWIDTLKTKINALYYYGTKSDTGAFDYVREHVETLLEQPIDYVIAINYTDLSPLVDILGGIEVTVENAFIDDHYPNPKYTESTLSGEPVFKTVTFESGVQHLDGARALEFVRSRQSADEEEGSDLARSARQSELMRGIIAKILTKQTALSPFIMGSLYTFWDTRIERTLPDSDVFSMAWALKDARGLSITYKSLPVYPDDPSGVITHPDVKKYGQWVWEPVGGDWIQIQKYIDTIFPDYE